MLRSNLKADFYKPEEPFNPFHKRVILRSVWFDQHKNIEVYREQTVERKTPSLLLFACQTGAFIG